MKWADKSYTPPKHLALVYLHTDTRDATEERRLEWKSAEVARQLGCDEVWYYRDFGVSGLPQHRRDRRALHNDLRRHWLRFPKTRATVIVADWAQIARTRQGQQQFRIHCNDLGFDVRCFADEHQNSEKAS
jgi:hypothetical protein